MRLKNTPTLRTISMLANGQNKCLDANEYAKKKALINVNYQQLHWIKVQTANAKP